MNKLKNFNTRIKKYLIKNPKMIIPTSAVIFVIIFAVFECVRAKIYLNSVENYKSSAEILNIQKTVKEIDSVYKSDSQAYLCNIKLSGLISKENDAYFQESTIINLEDLLAKLNGQVQTAKPSPSYNSLMQFLPKPSRANYESNQIFFTLSSLDNLSKYDYRSEYCLQLENALAEVYFLNDIRNPEAVSALNVGQVENFQINISKTKELLLEIKAPVQFLESHGQIYKLLNDIGISLREDSNEYENFSRRIDKDVILLETSLTDISDDALDLKFTPAKISLQAHNLE